jgi:hypothetical protein
VEVLRRHVAREYPDAREGETKERLQARWAALRARRGRDSAGPPAGRVTELERLAALHDRGVLSDSEFDSQKGLILGGS